MVEWAQPATIPIGSVMATRTSRVVLVIDRSRPIAAEPTRGASPGLDDPSEASMARVVTASAAVASSVMSTADDKPMSGTTFVVMTVLMVLGALFRQRCLVSTVAFLFKTLLHDTLVGCARWFDLKARPAACVIVAAARFATGVGTT